MTSVLVIAHPDDWFKNQIGRLQIQWMMQDRKTLDAREGLRKGISAQQLYEVFENPAPWSAHAELLADYDALFGSNFPLCRTDMRPYLPDWASHVSLIEEPSVEEPDHDSGGRDHEDHGTDGTILVPDDLVRTVRKDFNHCSHADPAILGSWLSDRRVSGGNVAVFAAWCKHWETRANSATNLLEQKLTRDLFLQSLCRLYSFEEDGSTKAYAIADNTTISTACMLADIADGKPMTPQGTAYQEAIFVKANTKLHRVI